MFVLSAQWHDANTYLLPAKNDGLVQSVCGYISGTGRDCETKIDSGEAFCSSHRCQTESCHSSKSSKQGTCGHCPTEDEDVYGDGGMDVSGADLLPGFSKEDVDGADMDI